MEPEYITWLEAFWELSSERQLGFGYGKIPHSAIVQWSIKNDHDEDDAESFLGVIRAMDQVWLEYIAESRDDKTGSHSLGATQRKRSPDRISSRPLTPALFDALF